MQGYRNRDRQALLYGLGAVLAWSTVATAFKLALRELDVLQLVSLVFIATILGEAIHPATLVGLALIIPGVLLQQSQQPVPAV